MKKAIAPFLASCLALAAFPVVAGAADERKSPLADAPAIRQRVEVRDKRFEVGAGFTSTVGQDFYHAILVGGRIGFHLTDWLAIAGIGGFNLTPNFQTGLHDRLMQVLPTDPGTDRTPTQQEARNGMNKIGHMFGLQAELVPFAGKFSLFGKLFMNYDLYLFGGPGFVNFKADGACNADATGSCPVTGLKIGANVGVGFHAFINDFFALNLEIRDILLRNNPAGRDETGDGVRNKEDLSWDSNYMVGLNAMFFLPKAKVSP